MHAADLFKDHCRLICGGGEYGTWVIYFEDRCYFVFEILLSMSVDALFEMDEEESINAVKSFMNPRGNKCKCMYGIGYTFDCKVQRLSSLGLA